MLLSTLLVLASLAAAEAPAQQAPARFEFERLRMGVPVRIVLYAPDEQAAQRAAEAAFARLRQIDEHLSDYEPDNELGLLCRTAGQGRAVAVSDDLWRVLVHSVALAQRTDGAFDVTVGPVVQLWRRARRTRQLPADDQTRAALSLVGSRLLRVDAEHHTVELLKPGMRLDFGGVAKGYAVDQALAVLRQQGVTAAMVDAGGDLGFGDPPPGKPGWRVGLAPLDLNAPPSRFLWLSRRAMATSGDAFQYVEIGGRRYSHIVDPRTGVGLTVRSQVSVVAPDGITADGLSTAASVLGPEKGLALIDATPNAAAFIVLEREGKIETFTSRRWKDLPAAPALEHGGPEP